MRIVPMGSQRAGLVPLAWALAAALTSWSCNAPRQPAPPRAQETAQALAQETAQERVQRLEREARALARAEGCQAAGDCRAAPVGDRPCGGPRTYVVYCARRTDSAALYRKLDELARAERVYNEQQGLASTCEFRTPPSVVASGRSCREATP
ncbi:MAG: hypothetical protein ABR499_15075 [Gemmatimonadaceae bacterium]